MFERISDTEKLDKEALFYKASFLYCFEKVLKSPLLALDNYDGLKKILKLICGGAVKRFNERPALVLEIFFSKNRSDCMNIQDGIYRDDESPFRDTEQPLPSLEQLLVDYGNIDCEDPMAGDYIRKLAKVINGESNGSEFTRWLSKSMRQVLYDDMDDVVTGQQKQDGIVLEYFGFFKLMQLMLSMHRALLQHLSKRKGHNCC